MNISRRSLSPMLSNEDKQNLKVGATALAFVYLVILLMMYLGVKAVTVDNDPPHTIREWSEVKE